MKTSDPSDEEIPTPSSSRLLINVSWDRTVPVRKHSKIIQEDEKEILVNSSIFPDDVILQIFKFLRSETIIGVCMRISKQFYAKAIEIPLKFNFYGKKMNRDNLKLLLSSVHLANLTSLCLENNNIGKEGVKCFMNAQYLKNLKTLNLKGNNIGIGVKSLASNIFMKQLTKLNLNNNHMDNEAARAIATSEFLKELKVLKLCRNNISNKGIQYIAHSEYLHNLTILKLHYNPITNSTACLRSGFTHHLTVLDVGSCNIGSNDAKALSLNESLINLTELYINNNSLNEQCLFE
ncbi:hypothetical protein FDP41_011687 [Naegleria fowleri]|uniref:F-box domain-containing protein n=1 Tax=Naegleria fowleri TaxID=5763 RepID=A0A6A5C2B6_NAEFO|nr:uncharacterized protein FDP41_011687 [Naegleria fowleri]KAF0981826.1 hypothetical protein FDP41_011687 [Naegleria fowleri]CAG4710637.1 unnamed protein product [Naegleria fowleri]